MQGLDILTVRRPPKTYHEGANDERTAILAKVRRLSKSENSVESLNVLDVLVEWLLSRNERYKKNPGGL